jgi:hypothetical protein
MKKYECNKCHFKTDCTFTGSVKPECCAVSKKFSPDWHEVKEAVTDCNQLPKLTAEVFERPDCPEWAKYAAVDANGVGVYYRNKPKKEGKQWVLFGVAEFRCIGKFDASDWQKSLIERPAKEEKALPDWCKVGAIGYCIDCGYFEVKDMQADTITVKAIASGTEHCYSVIDAMFFKKARKRPFNAYEMRGLVGKVIRAGFVYYLVHTYLEYKGGEVLIGNENHYNADGLMGFTVDGKPCYVLEHLENGEWVE